MTSLLNVFQIKAKKLPVGVSQDDDLQNDDDDEDDERDEKKKKMAKVQRSNFKLFYTKSPQSSPCPCQRIQ